MRETYAKHAQTWRNMLKMGYSLRAIAREYKVDISIVRYHTNPEVRAAKLGHTNTYAKHQSTPAGMTAQPAAALPEVKVEYFSNMPAWPKPLWLASFEARTNVQNAVLGRQEGSGHKNIMRVYDYDHEEMK